MMNRKDGKAFSISRDFSFVIFHLLLVVPALTWPQTTDREESGSITNGKLWQMKNAKWENAHLVPFGGFADSAGGFISA